jgi:hypothetical protein
MGRRSFRCRRIRNSSLEKRFVGVRRDMLTRGMLVRGVRSDGKSGCSSGGQ